MVRSITREVVYFGSWELQKPTIIHQAPIQSLLNRHPIVKMFAPCVLRTNETQVHKATFIDCLPK